MTNKQKWFVLVCLLLGIVGGPAIYSQMQQSGGPGSTVTANAGTNLNTSLLALDSTLTGGTLKAEPYDGTNVIGTAAHPVQVSLANSATNSTAVKVDGSGVTQPVSGTVSVNALPSGTANIGLVRILPSACTQSTNFANATAQVATSTGTTVTSTTTCVTSAYANNITNSACTLRLADKAGTPVIWLGGANDFSIPANSNVKVPIDGVTFTSGITAIAGTGSCINLQINGVQ